MTEPAAPANDDGKPLDPKAAMRAALDAKKNAQAAHEDGTNSVRSMGSTHTKAAGKRQFRRKSGG